MNKGHRAPKFEILNPVQLTSRTVDLRSPYVYALYKSIAEQYQIDINTISGCLYAKRILINFITLN